MKITVYDKLRRRWLTDEELEGKFYYTGMGDYSLKNVDAEIERFEFNLLTCKIQTNFDNACTELTCCFPCEMFADNDDFEVFLDEWIK